MLIAATIVSLLHVVADAARSQQGPLPRPSGSGVVATVAVDTLIDVEETPRSALLRAVTRDGPRYPIAQRNARIGGEVRVSFTVDTTGKILRGSTEIIAESDRAFSRAVCEFLPHLRFASVVMDGRRLTVRVTNQRFAFSTRG